MHVILILAACLILFALAYRFHSHYHVFRWLGADAVPTGFGCWQLVRVRGGGRRCWPNARAASSRTPSTR